MRFLFLLLFLVLAGCATLPPADSNRLKPDHEARDWWLRPRSQKIEPIDLDRSKVIHAKNVDIYILVK